MKKMTIEDLEHALLQTQAELATVTRVLGTAIAWIAGTAGSPLSVGDATRLLDMLPPEK